MSSDHHFGHENIIRYCGQPFKSLGEMNYEMTRRWNDTVAPRDTVYYLGDFAMGDPDMWPKFCKRLNGTKVLVRGNHDKGPERMLSVGFAEVHENIVVEIGGVRVWMNHYPIDTCLTGAATCVQRRRLKLARFRGHFLTYVEGVHYGQESQGLPRRVSA